MSIAHERGEYSSAQTATHELGHKSVSVSVSVGSIILAPATLDCAYFVPNEYRLKLNSGVQ